MRKTLAIYITDSHGKVECVWEWPLGPFAQQTDDEIIAAFRDGAVPWSSLTDADEPDGWRNWRMEVRHYGKE